MPIVQSRRRLLTNLAVAGAAGLSGLGAAGTGGGRKSLAAEAPPEITRLRLFEVPITCIAPQWVARELLYSEGFTDVEYVTWGKHTQAWVPEVLLSGQVDISLSFLPPTIAHVDAGEPVVMLAGSHIGCVSLVATNRVGSTRDLKGKTVGITQRGSDEEIFISMFAAYVGLDPRKDINWVISPDWSDHVRQLTEGTIDAAMAKLPPELVEKKGGHILVNTTTDKPWSQDFCCMIASTRGFVSRHPVATKRALRALLKAADLCASEPERVARLIAERDVPPFYDWHYEDILDNLKKIPYGQWRDYDPEDSVRFHALWMREVGMLKKSPQELIANGTDWRFLNELKRELKT